MVVNDSPGEECRIAILENNHLEELYTEHAATATNVGNIYKGRVYNIEPAIQAAFIDYGHGRRGFLHISDLHPRYFPGDERVERVGRKIPRRERPPIQDALRRGDEVLVQVLKEGIGTKGPTLTSYLSIPGRLLVLMPDMDRVGVSRKVEDEEGRREMRKVLDTLDLPEGFGFILRTAGLGRTKTELKRDVAYLMRLWKVMERRIKGIGAPCELYTESDLLIRSIRDVLRPSISAVIVDSESAYERVTNFLSVIAPRSAPKVLRYRRATPIFHAFDIERQIDLIHSREVPLPSGGRLVIDQTEALVAIDVNSGRSRSARDSETNAFRTNCEAVDEICRQLRLRDLGGLLIHDLIDMRASRHRRQIEDRFHQNLKRDRAKTTVLRISEFGLVEMTRQRMRPSMRKSHFVMCSHCDGHGEIKAPESIASDVTRHTGFLLDHDRVRRVEIVCSPRVASVLLSRKRRELVRLEEETGKMVDVRVSDDIAPSRVDYYAYDERNADIDVAMLPLPKVPTLEELEEREKAAAAAPPEETAPEQTGRRKRSRRRRRAGPADATAIALAGGYDDEADEEDEAVTGVAEPAPKKTRSRRRRRRRRAEAEAAGANGRAAAPEAEVAGATPAEVESPAPAAAVGTEADSEKPLRIHELAKELGVASREVIERCHASGAIEVKNHMSSVSPQDACVIRDWFAGDEEPEMAPVGGAEGPAGSPPAGAADAAEPGEGRGRRRRRRGGRRRSGRGSGGGAGGAVPAGAAGDAGGVAGNGAGPGAARRTNGASAVPATDSTARAAGSDDGVMDEPGEAAGRTGRKKKKRSRRKRSSGAAAAPREGAEVAADAAAASGAPAEASTEAAARKRRALYASRRKVARPARDPLAEIAE